MATYPLPTAGQLPTVISYWAGSNDVSTMCYMCSACDYVPRIYQFVHFVNCAAQFEDLQFAYTFSNCCADCQFAQFLNCALCMYTCTTTTTSNHVRTKDNDVVLFQVCSLSQNRMEMLTFGTSWTGTRHVYCTWKCMLDNYCNAH